MTQMQIVTFNQDEKAVVLKSTKDLFFAAKQLHEWISGNNLSQEMAGILPSLIESHFGDIAKQLGYESVLTKEKEERHREIRRSNERIRELEKQMGESRPVDGLKEQIHYLTSIVSKWWKEHGFRHVSDAGFTDYGIYKAKFCFLLGYMGSMFSQTPETDKAQHKSRLQQLHEEGWDIGFDTHGNDPHLIDNDNNRKRLIELIESRFPSAEVVRTRNHYSNRRGHYEFRDIEVYIRDLHDITGKAVENDPPQNPDSEWINENSTWEECNRTWNGENIEEG
ncbi:MULTISPECIES: hypothetical protein [unclassified Paenibacillus]|uniref:hypothetical protein n=1 Tax=unclassified Paenibacillus TaxID=185978 RepID=UPI002473188A|nr:MULTISPECIES: hypothetical protein [unclassified Paenibacillus]MDH6427241.1 hypothetical protein [Paenibacillus sp. PastH-4]MDH6443271.1 hypothetical protein [Paenibacillus sp. PastF-4]MDH6526025.1 hypothetical protein [Paenibacillus sp. PastH-3]